MGSALASPGRVALGPKACGLSLRGAEPALPSNRLLERRFAVLAANDGGKESDMDQPTAEAVLKKLAPLVGEWRVTATGPAGEPWPGESHTSFEWHDSAAHLVQRSSIETPEAPNSISIIGCDAANGTYYQLYSDDRGVCRVYGMSIGDGEWRLWRDGRPFSQRFTGKFEDDGRKIVGRWEKAEDGTNYTTDFDLTYSRVQ